MNKSLVAQVTKENDVYTFEISGYIKSYSIYYSRHRALTDKVYLTTGNTPEIVVKLPEEGGRVFFTIQEEGGQSVVCAAQLVGLRSIDNLRDIGGYRTREGRYVKWGYFYRGANLGYMSEADKNYLEHMQIRTLFDLRSLAEVEAEPDRIPDGCQYMNYSGIVTMDEQIKEQVNFDMKQFVSDLMVSPEKIGQFTDFLMDGYRTMAVSSDAFKKLFEVIKEEEQVPVVFHCTAGKDRTGIGAAFILLALGVDEETVIADYCLSNVYREAVNNRQVQALGECVKEAHHIALLREMLEVKEAYIRMTLDTIYEAYPSFEMFLEKQLNVSPEELNQLKEKYLYQ